MEQTLARVVQEKIDNYAYDTVAVTEQYNFSQYDTIEKIDNYVNSKFVTGGKDSQGNDKPFFNILKGRLNVAVRATDIDRKNIRIKATRSGDYFKAFVASKKNQEFMNRSQFNLYLNTWGEMLPRYGSVVTKVVQKGKDLFVEYIPWSRLITDQVKFTSGPVIERLFITPEEARLNKAWDQEQVEKLIARFKTTRKDIRGFEISFEPDFLEVYEVHGSLPLAYLNGTTEYDKTSKEWTTYVQQMHILSFYTDEEDSKQNICLYKGREKKSPYVISSWFDQPGRTLGVGVVEDLFEAQKWTNYNVKLQKDQLDISSKSLFQTSDIDLAGRNVITSLQSGQVLIHAPNQPITSVNTTPQAFPALQAMNEAWKGVSSEITSTPDAIQGNTFPSGTAWRQVQILNQEAHGMFEYITERKGNAIEELYREYIIPYIISQLDTTEELVAELDTNEIEYFDNAVADMEVTKLVKEAVLRGDAVPSQEQIDVLRQTVKDQLSKGGMKRFLSPGNQTWKEYFKDFEWECEVEVTNESSDKTAELETLTTALTLMSQNPMMLQDPNSKKIFDRILETSGVLSPSEFGSMPPRQPVGPQVPPNGATSPQQNPQQSPQMV